MRFTKSKVSELSGQTVVIFVAEQGPEFRLTASKQGVRVEGVLEPIETMAELQAFAKVMSDAWVEHTKLKVKIVPADHGGNL